MREVTDWKLNVYSSVSLRLFLAPVFLYNGICNHINMNWLLLSSGRGEAKIVYQESILAQPLNIKGLQTDGCEPRTCLQGNQPYCGESADRKEITVITVTLKTTSFLKKKKHRWAAVEDDMLAPSPNCNSEGGEAAAPESVCNLITLCLLSPWWAWVVNESTRAEILRITRLRRK